MLQLGSCVPRDRGVRVEHRRFDMRQSDRSFAALRAAFQDQLSQGSVTLAEQIVLKRLPVFWSVVREVVVELCLVRFGHLIHSKKPLMF